MAPVCAVVVAGGSGQRFGNPGGKQLVNVAGRPLMSWSIRAFDRSDKVGHIVVVCPAERRARCAAWPSTRLTMTRPSVLPMPAIPARTPPVPACMRYRRVSNMSPSHDGARPLITTEAIDHAIDVLVGDRSLDGVVCGQPRSTRSRSSTATISSRRRRASSTGPRRRRRSLASTHEARPHRSYHRGLYRDRRFFAGRAHAPASAVSRARAITLR